MNRRSMFRIVTSCIISVLAIWSQYGPIYLKYLVYTVIPVYVLDVIFINKDVRYNIHHAIGFAATLYSYQMPYQFARLMGWQQFVWITNPFSELSRLYKNRTIQLVYFYTYILCKTINISYSNYSVYQIDTTTVVRYYPALMLMWLSHLQQIYFCSKIIKKLLR